MDSASYLWGLSSSLWNRARQFPEKVCFDSRFRSGTAAIVWAKVAVFGNNRFPAIAVSGTSFSTIMDEILWNSNFFSRSSSSWTLAYEEFDKVRLLPVQIQFVHLDGFLFEFIYHLLGWKVGNFHAFLPDLELHLDRYPLISDFGIKHIFNWFVNYDSSTIWLTSICSRHSRHACGTNHNRCVHASATVHDDHNWHKLICHSPSIPMKYILNRLIATISVCEQWIELFHRRWEPTLNIPFQNLVVRVYIE